MKNGTLDWRDDNDAYPSSQDQDKPNDCGCCFAFASVGVLDILFSYIFQITTYFSKQQILDCADNLGCDGGALEPTYAYMKDPGVVLEDDYPYEAKKIECRYYNTSDDRATLQLFDYYNVHGEDAIAEAVYYSPVTVAVNAEAIQFYKSGILTPSKEQCSRDPNKVNHAVIVIGFGVDYTCDPENPTPYWILRNSWGANWGEQGTLRMARGINACAIGLSDNYVAELVENELTKKLKNKMKTSSKRKVF